MKTGPWGACCSTEQNQKLGGEFKVSPGHLRFPFPKKKNQNTKWSFQKNENGNKLAK